MEYCSKIPPLEQLAGGLPPPPPTVMVPVGVLKREGIPKQRSEGAKSVMFSDGETNYVTFNFFFFIHLQLLYGISFFALHYYLHSRIRMFVSYKQESRTHTRHAYSNLFDFQLLLIFNYSSCGTHKILTFFISAPRCASRASRAPLHSRLFCFHTHLK